MATKFDKVMILVHSAESHIILGSRHHILGVKSGAVQRALHGYL